MSSPFAGESKAHLRAFYGELLGLREVPPPSALAHLDLVWFAAGDGLELHFFRGEADPTAARHFCLDIEDLEPTAPDHSGAEGVGVDAKGNVYGAVVRRQMLEKHIKK